MKHTTHFLLLAMFVSGISAVSAAEPPKLDADKPIAFDIQLGPAKFPADAPRDKVRGAMQPALLGGYLEGGKVTGAYAPNMTAVYAAGLTPEAYPWELCPYGPWVGFQSEASWSARIRAVTASVSAAGFQGSWAVAFGRDDPVASPATTPEWTIRITATPSAVGYEGTYEGTCGDMPVSGVCVVRARNVPAGMIDPANALYQVIGGAYRVFIEVRGGKAVQAVAVASAETRDSPYREPLAPAGATRLFPADASGMTIAIADEGLAGKAATLGGKITVTPDPKTPGSRTFVPVTLALDGVVLSGAGKQRAGKKGSPVTLARSYPLADPLATRAIPLLRAAFLGTRPVSPEFLAQAKEESLRDDVQPASSEATRYTHRLWHSTSSIYAPWLDFDAVPSAARYRFEVHTVDVHNRLVQPAVGSCEAPSPHASLAPIWEKVPVAAGPREKCALQVTALDAGGKPLGTPQGCSLQRRVPFAADMVATPDAAVLLELALRQPTYLDERFHSHLYLTEAVLAANNGVPALEYGPAHWHYSQHLMAEAATDPAARAQYLRLLDTFNRRRLRDGSGPFQIPYHYGAVLGGVVQETGRNHLNALDAQFDAATVTRLNLWLDYFARLQQPSGSWCNTEDRGELQCVGGFSLWGTRFLENSTAPWPPFLARLRHYQADPAARALGRAVEERAVAWLRNNTLRTGFGELLHQQTDPSDMTHSAGNQIEYPIYVLRHAPPSQRDVVMAADVLRRIEDLFTTWEALPRAEGGNLTFGQSLYAVEALNLLELYALTGDPLMRAKSEVLASSYLQRADPCNGSTKPMYDRFMQETDDPDWIVRWATRYREVCATPPAAIPERHLSLTLDRLVDGVDRVTLDLALADGRVTQALARTPTWDGPGMNFHQPGRLFTRPGKALFHAADASGLTVSAEGLGGTLKLTLTPPQGGEPRVVTVALKATRFATRGWRGTWTQGDTRGRIEGLTLADEAPTGDRQIFVQVQEALHGGEAWQTWALAGAVLPANGAATAGTLNNPNTGWVASTVKLDTCTLKGEAFTLSMNAEVTWLGIAEQIFGMANDAKGGPGSRVTFAAPHESLLARLARWQIPGKDLNLGFALRPEQGDRKPDEPLIYETSWKPVTPGSYHLDLTGTRLGDILYGQATITGPDGKKATRQFLGDVETVRITSEDPAGFEGTGD